MEKYINKVYDEPVEIKSVCDMPLSALMDLACVKASDALQIVRKINQHMFAVGNPDGKSEPPDCFKSALVNHDCTLMQLCDELMLLAERLGV